MARSAHVTEIENRSRARRYYNGVSFARTARCWALAIALSASALLIAPVLRAQQQPPPALAALDPRWTLALESPPAAEPAFDRETAYVPTRAGTFAAVDLDRGIVRWQIELDVPVAPAVGDGRVFVATGGEVVALDGATGNALWRTPLPGTIAAPLYWDTGWLLVSNDAGDLAAFRAEDGALVWRQPLGAPLVVAPVPALERLFLALTDGRVLAADLATGEVRWTRKLDGRVTGLLALDNQLVVGSTANVVQSFNLMTGRPEWRWRVGADVVGASAADEQHIYFVALDNVVRAVDRRSGNLRWTQPLPTRAGGGPVVMDDTVLVPFVSNEIAAFTPADGTPLFTIQSLGELGARPHLRSNPFPTRARIVTINREGTLQGLAPRFEPPPAPLEALPGVPVGGF